MAKKGQGRMYDDSKHLLSGLFINGISYRIWVQMTDKERESVREEILSN